MPMRLETPLPDLSVVAAWLDSRPSPDDLAGHPVLIYFWSLSCHICHENMPKLSTWRAMYAPKGLHLVAIHVPRSEEETDLDKVRRAAAEFHVIDPCGLDNEHALVHAFDNKFLPAYFLFDSEHHLRSRTAGDAGLNLLGDVLKRLFPEE